MNARRPLLLSLVGGTTAPERGHVLISPTDFRDPISNVPPPVSRGAP